MPASTAQKETAAKLRKQFKAIGLPVSIKSSAGKAQFITVTAKGDHRIEADLRISMLKVNHQSTLDLGRDENNCIGSWRAFMTADDWNLWLESVSS